MNKSLLVFGVATLLVGCGQSVTINTEPVPTTPAPVVVEVPVPVVEEVEDIVEIVPSASDLQVVTKGLVEEEVPTADDPEVKTKGSPEVTEKGTAEEAPTAEDPQVINKGASAPAVEAVAVVEEVVVVDTPDYGPILGKAIQGYDPVAYFNVGPTVGRDDLHVTHEGATYYFASEANREAFYADPARYAPLYGGFCAYAIGTNGDFVEVNPKTFKIVDGKLNLFFSC